MDVEGDFASTDIRYRGKGLVRKGGSKLKANFTTPLTKSKKKVSVVVGAGEKVEKVEGVKENSAEYCGNEKVENVVERNAKS